MEKRRWLSVIWKKKYFFVFVLFLLCILSPGKIYAASEITVLSTDLYVQKGKTVSLPINNEGEGKLTYTVSNSSIAKVAKNGAVTGKKVGKTKVTVKLNKKKAAIITVHVYKKKVCIKSLSFDKTNITLKKGKTKTLKVSYKPSNATAKNIWFGSSNKAVATVSASGKITAKAAGTAIITAAVPTADVKGGNVIARCKVVVTDKYTKNREKLRKYINKKGEKFTYYNRGALQTIQWEETDKQGVKHIYRISILSDGDNFVFQYNYEDPNWGDFDVHGRIDLIESTNSVILKSEDCFGFQEYYFSDIINKKNISKKPSLKFKFIDEETFSGDWTEKTATKNTNKQLKYALSKWNSYLKKKTGLTLKDLGYANYK